MFFHPSTGPRCVGTLSSRLGPGLHMFGRPSSHTQRQATLLVGAKDLEFTFRSTKMGYGYGNSHFVSSKYHGDGGFVMAMLVYCKMKEPGTANISCDHFLLAVGMCFIFDCLKFPLRFILGYLKLRNDSLLVLLNYGRKSKW